MLRINATAEGLTFWVMVQPRSSINAIAGPHQDALKVKLTAPPVEGAANRQCIEVLAKALALPKSTLSIVSGQTSRRKQIRIHSLTGSLLTAQRQELERKLRRLAGEGE